MGGSEETSGRGSGGRGMGGSEETSGRGSGAGYGFGGGIDGNLGNLVGISNINNGIGMKSMGGLTPGNAGVFSGISYSSQNMSGGRGSSGHGDGERGSGGRGNQSMSTLGNLSGMEENKQYTMNPASYDLGNREIGLDGEGLLENFSTNGLTTDLQCNPKDKYLKPTFIYLFNPQSGKYLSMLSSAPDGYQVFLDPSKADYKDISESVQDFNKIFVHKKPMRPEEDNVPVVEEERERKPFQDDPLSTMGIDLNLPTKWEIVPTRNSTTECAMFIRTLSKNPSKKPNYYLEYNEQLSTSLFGGKTSQMFILETVTTYEGFLMVRIVPNSNKNMCLHKYDLQGYGDGTSKVICTNKTQIHNDNIMQLNGRSDIFVLLTSNNTKTI